VERASIPAFGGAPVASVFATVKKLLSFQQSTRKGLVTHALRRVSPRECQQPAPALASGAKNLGRFTFRLRDSILAVQQTEEAFAGASERPVANVAGWMPLSLVNLTWIIFAPSPVL